MNCPFHVMIYKTTAHSYRDLPVRLASGDGLSVRARRRAARRCCPWVPQDDAHIICAEESLEDQGANKVLRLALEYLRAFGFEADIMLSTRPEKFVGEPSLGAPRRRSRAPSGRAGSTLLWMKGRGGYRS